MSQHFNWKNIRALLSEGFNPHELRRFCHDEFDFRPVYDQLAANTGKAEIVDQLVEYAGQKGLIEKLLAWAKENNPAKYNEYQPYHNISVPVSDESGDVSANPQKFIYVQPKTGDSQFMTEQIKQPSNSPVDFLIITPLVEERDAFLRKLSNPKKLNPFDDDIQVYFESNLPLTSGRGMYRVIVMPLLDMGRVQAAIATKDAIRQWKPRYVILVGIAGGIEANKVKLGDVVIGNQIVDYELQKQTADEVDIRWKVYPVNQRLLGEAQNFIDKTWSNLINVKRPQRGHPKCHIGPIASGDKVIDYAQALEKYRETWSKLIGIEMEAGGVALSALQTEKQTEFFMIRGVSDLADGDKNASYVKKWRTYACDVAASYTIALLKSGPVPLVAIGVSQLADTQQFVDINTEHHFSFDNSISNHEPGNLPAKAERMVQKNVPQRYQVLWQVQTSFKPKHFFASPDYLCLVDNKAIHFFSTHDGKPLLLSVTTLGKFSLMEYDIIGGTVTSSGNVKLLLTLLPRNWTYKACLLALKLEQQKSQLSVEWVYEAPDAQLSPPTIDDYTIYLIQAGSQLVTLNSENGRVQRTISLPTQYNLLQDCVSLILASNYFYLALCDGAILGLDSKTGQIVTKLYEDSNQLPLSPLATDGWRLFFGILGRVYALDIVSRQEEWSFELPAEFVGQDQLIKGQPLVINNIVCFAGGNYLYVLDQNTGQELWRYQMPNRIKSGPKWIDDSIVVADRKGNIHALQFGISEFIVTCHYDLRTPPTLNAWNPVILTVINIGHRTAYNTTLRLPSNEFKGVSEHHTQELFTIAPGELKHCEVKFQPRTKGSTVYLPIIVEFENDSEQAKQELDLFIQIREVAPNRELSLPPDRNSQYNFVTLRALLMAALTNNDFAKLCQIHFQSLYKTFEPNLSQLEKIKKLIEYTDQHQQMEQLLQILQQQYPRQYSHYIQDIKLAVRVPIVNQLANPFDEFDVFLAHHNQDKPQVEAIAEKLRQRGLKPWLDKEQIAPGRWFQDVIQSAIKNVKSAAIFIGPNGLGKWQIVELRTFISRCVDSGLPVIPVLLPGVNHIPEDLLFLKELNWVPFTREIDDIEALDNLEWGITGRHPHLFSKP